MSEQQSSYRQIFKATSLFGGVQVFNIIIGIVRVKFVAVLLGTVGVGIMNLLNAPLHLIISITGLGISFSAIRDISEAHGSEEKTKLAIAITTLRRWSWFTGLLGTLVTLILAPFLSQWAFGNHEYTWAFIWLSATIFLKTMSSNQITIIQGTRRLKEMAKASVFGSLIGLFTAVPLYYFFGVKGIVPSLIITAFSGLILSWYFSHKIKIKPIIMSNRETFYNGKNMAKLGIIMTITGIIGYLTAYLLSVVISRIGGIEQVGLYNAGWSIIGQSTGLVFVAMTADYFPRLAAINQDNSKISILVNQQAEMVTLILGPLLILLIGAMPILIHLLYTPDFLPVVIFANWLVMGILIKGIVWPVGFIFPAKGDLKIFGLIEISSMIFNITTDILGYKLYGLEGLGISFILNFIFGLTTTFIFANKKYGFKYSKSTLNVFFINLTLLSIVFSISYFVSQPTSYYYIIIIFIVSVIYSFVALDKRLGLRVILINYLDLIKKKH